MPLRAFLNMQGHQEAQQLQPSDLGQNHRAGYLLRIPPQNILQLLQIVLGSKKDKDPVLWGPLETELPPLEGGPAPAVQPGRRRWQTGGGCWREC